MPITDADFEAFKATLNGTIHELVFACHHLEDDEIEEAQIALMTAQGNLERVAELLAMHAA